MSSRTSKADPAGALSAVYDLLRREACVPRCAFWAHLLRRGRYLASARDILAAYERTLRERRK